MTDSLPEHQNILLLLSDQHRWSALGCYGNEQVHSPHFDALASEGALYRICISNHPVCAPYRCTLQTGLYMHQHGAYSNGHVLAPSFRCMADHFRDAGFATGYIGKTHWYGNETPGFVPESHRLRWETWHACNNHNWFYDPPDFDDRGEMTNRYRGRYNPEVQTDLAIEFIGANRHRPWVLQLNWTPPHAPIEFLDEDALARARQLNRSLEFGLPDAFFQDSDSLKHRFPFHLLQRVVPYRNLDQYDADQIEVEPNVEYHLRPVMRHMLKEYYAMVSSLDDQLGRIVAALEALHLRENTTIIYTSDHGDLVGSHSNLTECYRRKSLPYQNAYRVPLIIAGAGIPPETEVDTPVGSVDLLPTILDLAGLPPATDLPGRSMRVGVDGRTGSESEVVLMGLHNWRAVHDGRYCYAVFFDADESTLLIDTERDPYDVDNLLERSELHPIAQRLHQRLCEKLREVGDLDCLERVSARYEFQ